jgi:hypothetical protein
MKKPNAWYCEGKADLLRAKWHGVKNCFLATFIIQLVLEVDTQKCLSTSKRVLL